MMNQRQNGVGRCHCELHLILVFGQKCSQCKFFGGVVIHHGKNLCPCFFRKLLFCKVTSALADVQPTLKNILNRNIRVGVVLSNLIKKVSSQRHIAAGLEARLEETLRNLLADFRCISPDVHVFKKVFYNERHTDLRTRNLVFKNHCVLCDISIACFYKKSSGF